MKRTILLLLTTVLTCSSWASDDLGYQINFDIDGNFAYVPPATSGPFTTDSYTLGGAALGMGAGVRFREFLYVGAAFQCYGDWGRTLIYNTSMHTAGTVRYELWMLPIYADLRLYYPTGGRCFPFWEVGVGGYVGLRSNAKTDVSLTGIDVLIGTPAGGFYFTTGLGVEFKHVSLGVGYKLFNSSALYDHHGYVKLGFSIGRNAQLR